MRGNLVRFISLLVLGGTALILYRAWTQVGTPPPIHPSPPIPVDSVKICPCYQRLTTPSRKELLANLNRVVSVTDTIVGIYRATRSNTLLIRFPGFKVVIFPELTQVVEDEGKLPFLKAGRIVTVRGLLVNHPRYGIEIILKRPQDLVVGFNA